jgi:hypothetical protein
LVAALLAVLLVKHGLGLLHGISLDPLTVEGILSPWLDLTVNESSGETSHYFLGFIVGSGLTCFNDLSAF